MIDISKLSPEIEKFEDRWIAMDESEEKIVVVGDNALEATADAEQNGYQQTILFKVPSLDSAFIHWQPSNLIRHYRGNMPA